MDESLIGIYEGEPLTLAAIEGLKRKGFTQSDIARMFGKTRGAVSYHVRTYGGTLTPRQTVMQHFPFVVPVAMGMASPCRNLRNHGEKFATGGVGMDPVALKRLENFYKRLRDEVVEFDRTLPPEEGVSTAGGWAYRPRLESDEDLLIRVNEYTDLTDQGRLIWRLPPMEP